MFLARVIVTLKPAVNDPPGLTVMGSLKTLGFESVESVRLGKFLEVRLDTPDRAAAETQIATMCSQLLANPVIEEYRFEVEEVPSPGQ